MGTEGKVKTKDKEVKKEKRMLNGSFLLIDYCVEDAETNELIDTTMEKVAKERNFSGRDQYFPILVVLGEGRLLPALEKEISTMKEGEERIIVLSPEEAYGSYDESKVVTFSLNRIRRLLGSNDIRPGALIDLEGKRGVIKTVSGGRVKVDFNHPLAGKSLRVMIRVEKVLKKREEKIKALASDIFDVEPSKFETSFKESILTIELPKLAYSKRDCFIRKVRFLSALMKYMPEVEKVRFIETFEMPKQKEEIS